MTKALQASRHSRYFRRQLEELARRLDALTMAEREFLLDHAINSALALLRQALGIEKQSERCRDYLYDAAVKLIERRLDDPSLDATLIADLLGCSRATLYRAFRGSFQRCVWLHPGATSAAGQGALGSASTGSKRRPRSRKAWVSPISPTSAVPFASVLAKAPVNGCETGAALSEAMRVGILQRCNLMS